MLPIVITSLVLAKKRGMMEIISPTLRSIWEHWELRLLVSLSLLIQLILILLGNRRKNIPYYWIRIVVWLAYLSADTVAIYALGITTSELPQKRGAGSADPRTELRAFWAPFLLMHLGGPDTITAYSLEDNELWLRHLLGLANQAAATYYIFFLAWNGSYLSLLSVVVMVCGLIKYGERVWVLWAASSEKFRDSTPEPRQKFPKTLEEQKLKEAEGYVVVPHQVIELREVRDQDVEADFTSPEKKLSPKQRYKRSQGEILIARGLVDIFLRAFTDLQFSLEDRDTSTLTFKGKHFLVAFDIIAIELGFIYDLLFTKAMAIQTWWGFVSRVISLSCTSIALVLFALASKKASNLKIDLYLTFALLGGAVFLELYASSVHLFSDKVTCWLIKHKQFGILNVVNWVQPLHRRQRWSNAIGQFSLVSYSLKEKHLPCYKILQLLSIDENVEKFFYKGHQNVSNALKHHIYVHVAEKPTQYTDLQSMWSKRRKHTLQQIPELESLKWTTELEFDMCVVVWHIATEICCHAKDLNITDYTPESEENYTEANIERAARISLHLSRYMMYLLVMYPFILPTGIGRIKFQDMYAKATMFFDEHRSAGLEDMTGTSTSAEKNQKQKCGAKKPRLSIAEACDLLRNQVNTQLNLAVSSGDKSKFVLFYGCKLASQLEAIEDKISRWSILSETWMGMLAFAAFKCKGSYHAQQLRRGGELLTHVWLLMCHFGLTDHFQIPHNVEIAELNIK